MGFDRGALNAVLLATTVGFAIGGAIGVVSPTFAEAGPAARSRPPATVVTDVDVLGSDHMVQRRRGRHSVVPHRRWYQKPSQITQTERTRGVHQDSVRFPS